MATTITDGDGADDLVHRSGIEPLVYFGNGGADRVRGFTLDDELYGGLGRDSLSGWSGADLIDGGDEIDIAGYATVDQQVGVTLDMSTGIGSGGDAQGDMLISIEIIEGSPFDDDIDGADVLIRADGNGGDDMIRLSGTDQAAYGDDGDDTLDLSEGFGGSAWGGDDDDTLIGSEHLDRLFGGFGNDVLYAGGGVAEVLTGGDGDDTMFGTPEDDTLYGGRGADTYWGGGGLDMVWVGQQDRSEGMVIDLNGGLSSGGDAEGDSFNGIATLFGMTAFDDVVLGNALDNDLLGGDGNDRLEGADGDDRMRGGFGDDTLYGGGDDDSIDGDQGSDLIRGGEGDDFIRNGSGLDTVYAGAGEDTLEAGSSWTEPG
ncbi:MAG: calcium-binding protein, partial [Pseudomonadota bacterium]